MALTQKDVENADKLIQGKFGKAAKRPDAVFHFVTDTTVREKFKEAYPDDGFTGGGFVDPRSKPFQVWIDSGYVRSSVVIHEAMHLYSMGREPLFPKYFGNSVSEGVTEYLTRKVAGERRLEYPKFLNAIQEIVDYVGNDEAMIQTYFTGSTAWQCAVGPDTFARWNQKIRSGDFEGALKVLKNPTDKKHSCKKSS